MRCLRYSFMPNRLKFCGPDKNSELFGYFQSQQADMGLNLILKDFQTLYSYLKLIARVNRIKDPFDERVVEAYWIGSPLLDNIPKNTLYNHLLDEQQLKKKLNRKLLSKVAEKIPLGAKPHHSFHVINVWKRTGNADAFHTLNSIDLCRISWGKIKKIELPDLIVEYQPLVVENNQLELGQTVDQKIIYSFDREELLKNPKKGDWVASHWGFACEILKKGQVENLKKYTKESIRLVNC